MHQQFVYAAAQRAGNFIEGLHSRVKRCAGFYFRDCMQSYTSKPGEFDLGHPGFLAPFLNVFGKRHCGFL